MAQYDITSTAFLPSGDTVVGQAVVKISDKHIAMLDAAIKACNTIDVGELNLENNMPQLYEILRIACEVATAQAVEAHYLRCFYNEGKVRYDIDDAMARASEDNLFYYDVGLDPEWYDRNPGEALAYQYDINCDVFEKWVDDYISSIWDDDAELILFMSRILNFGMTSLGEWDFTIEVPDCFKE